MRHHKLLQHSVDKLTHDMHAQRTRHHKARYLFGVGATLLLSGTAVLLSRPDWDFFPALLMAAGFVTWLIGWRKTN